MRPSISFLKKLAPIWILLVIVGSFMPYSFKHGVGTALKSPAGKLASEGDVTPWHRVVHFAMFGSTSAILVLIARRTTGRLAALTGVLFLSLGIESVQNIIDHYGIEWWDVRDDWLAASAVFFLLLSPRVRRSLVRY